MNDGEFLLKVFFHGGGMESHHLMKVLWILRGKEFLAVVVLAVDGGKEEGVDTCVEGALQGLRLYPHRGCHSALIW